MAKIPMKPKCLDNFAHAKCDVRNEEGYRGSVVRRVVAISRKKRPREMVGRKKYNASRSEMVNVVRSSE